MFALCGEGGSRGKLNSPLPLRERVDRAEGIRARAGRGVRFAIYFIAKPTPLPNPPPQGGREQESASGESEKKRRGLICITHWPSGKASGI